MSSRGSRVSEAPAMSQPPHLRLHEVAGQGPPRLKKASLREPKIGLEDVLNQGMTVLKGPYLRLHDHCILTWLWARADPSTTDRQHHHKRQQ